MKFDIFQWKIPSNENLSEQIQFQLTQKESMFSVFNAGFHFAFNFPLLSSVEKICRILEFHYDVNMACEIHENDIQLQLNKA